MFFFRCCLRLLGAGSFLSRGARTLLLAAFEVAVEAAAEADFVFDAGEEDDDEEVPAAATAPCGRGLAVCSAAFGRRCRCQRLRTAFSDRYPPSCSAFVAHATGPWRCTSFRSLVSSALVHPAVAALPRAGPARELARLAVPVAPRPVAPFAGGFFGGRPGLRRGAEGRLRLLADDDGSFGGRPGFRGRGRPWPLAASFAKSSSSLPSIFVTFPAYLRNAERATVE